MHAQSCVPLCTDPPDWMPLFSLSSQSFISSVVLTHDRILFAGDFNFHVDTASKNKASDFIRTMESFNFLRVAGPTHIHGHTLDLVFTLGLTTPTLTVEDLGISDHLCVKFSTTFYSDSTPKLPPSYSHVISSSTASQFTEAFLSSTPRPSDVPPSSPLLTEKLVAQLNSTCVNILDSIAPLKLRKPKNKTHSWLNNDNIRALRQLCRKAERKWKKDKLQISFQILRNHLHKLQEAVKSARSLYFSNLFSNSSHNPKILFNTINSVICPPPNTTLDPSPAKCMEFSTFFINKVEAIRHNFNPSTCNSTILQFCSSRLSSFSPISLPTLTQIVSSMKPATCPLDIIPTVLLKDVFATIGPSILSIVNSSIITGTVPSYFKHAVVQPLLKKPNTDPTQLKNYRPISKLPFLSKVLEKVILNQLLPYLHQYNILEKFQSGFKTNHSTESALFKIHNDLLLSIDSGNCAILILLDLSAAFDTVDHNILTDRLQHTTGIHNIALNWFKSYLNNRSFSVNIGTHSPPSPATLSCGVPQGSILGPIFFSIYMLPLGQIIQKYDISFHCYTDDTQLYLPLNPNDQSKITNIFNCINEIKSWMTENFLQLNEDKSEIILFGPPDNINLISSSLRNLSTLIKPHVKNLGVTFDSELKFDKQ